MSADTCPHCQADLRGESIPDHPSEWYSRKIGVEIRGVYDGVLFWRCPDCGGQWHRFPEGNHLRTMAEKYVNPTRAVNAERRAKRRVCAHLGITSGRQTRKLRKAIRRGEV